MQSTLNIERPGVMIVAYHPFGRQVYADYTVTHETPYAEVRVCADEDQLDRVASVLREIADRLPDLYRDYQSQVADRTENIAHAPMALEKTLKDCALTDSRDEAEAVRVFESARDRTNQLDDFPF